MNLARGQVKPPPGDLSPLFFLTVPTLAESLDCSEHWQAAKDGQEICAPAGLTLKLFYAW